MIEFKNEQIERLQESVARELGFNLIGHRLELFGTPLQDRSAQERQELARDIMRGLRALLVLAAFFAFTFPLMPLQLLFLWTGSRYARTFPNWYHRQVCRIVGIRLHIDGGVARDHGVLLISNHVSWLDITVLSAVAPVSFVAKQEVASWPFVSWLAKLQRSVFVDRTRRSEVTDKANEILRPAQSRRSRRAVRRRHVERRQRRGAVQDAALRRGEADGRRIRSAPTFAPRPWRSPTPSCTAFRSAAAGGPMVAWYGDMDLASHAWRLLGLGPLDAHIRIGPPVPLDDFADRKALARYAEEQGPQ